MDLFKRPRVLMVPSQGLETLPRDAFANLYGFLLGIDLLQLSYTSQRLRDAVDNSDEDDVWRSRINENYGTNGHNDGSFKRQFFADGSVRFRGTKKRPSEPSDRWSCADIASLELNGDTPVAFDMWISILPGDGDTYGGGILVGAQSTPFQSTQWPYYHQQFVHVDTKRKLYCSMVSKKRALATLQVERWYHLALMFDGRNQRVYLDGTVVSEDVGRIHHEAFSLRQMQLGSGCISGGSVGKPTATFCGWYGFHGIVDEFRTWPDVLSAEDVATLARGQILNHIQPRYSLRCSGANARQRGAKLIPCSRPRERICTQYK